MEILYNDANVVVKIKCSLCAKFESKLNHLKNFKKSFIVGISGSALKKDNLLKHTTSAPHRLASSLENKQELSITQVYTETPIGQALSKSRCLEEERVGKLIDSIPPSKRRSVIQKIPQFCHHREKAWGGSWKHLSD